MFKSLFGKRTPFNGNGHNNDVFVSQARDEDTVAMIQTKIKNLVAETYPAQENLVAMIESHGIPVVTDGPQLQLQLMLMVLGIQAGFVSPTFKRYEKLVNTLKSIFPEKAKMNFSKGLIICTKDTYHYAFLTYHFHHALSFEHRLDGYQDEAQTLYHQFINEFGGSIYGGFFDTLSVKEARMLKLAIRREREALSFIRSIMHEVFVPINNGRLFSGGTAQA